MTCKNIFLEDDKVAASLSFNTLPSDLRILEEDSKKIKVYYRGIHYLIKDNNLESQYSWPEQNILTVKYCNLPLPSTYRNIYQKIEVSFSLIIKSLFKQLVNKGNKDLFSRKKGLTDITHNPPKWCEDNKMLQRVTFNKILGVRDLVMNGKAKGLRTLTVKNVIGYDFSKKKYLLEKECTKTSKKSLVEMDWEDFMDALHKKMDEQ